jgi:hypothetical protein
VSADPLAVALVEYERRVTKAHAELVSQQAIRAAVKAAFVAASEAGWLSPKGQEQLSRIVGRQIGTQLRKRESAEEMFKEGLRR